jgi:hypothetical protein
MLINSTNVNVSRNMNSKYLVVVAAMANMLVGATALATEDAFAGKKKGYEKSQATSQANVCGNGEVPINVGCQNTNSQIQGDENSAALASQQTFEEEPEA